MSIDTTDTTLELAIRQSLDFDPRLPDPAAVAVAVSGGIATLRGTVGSFSQRRAATGDACKVDGVFDVLDEIDVRLLNDSRREDAHIRGTALQILIWDTDVPEEVVDVKVSDGWVTLTGEVSYQYERDAAFDDVADLVGILGVTNEIKVINP
jgi:osmotically-inducible protein OsmY